MPRPPGVNIEVSARDSDAQITQLASPFNGFLGVTRIGKQAYSVFDTEANAKVYVSAGRPPAP